MRQLYSFIFIIILLLSSFTIPCFAQLDTAFWFVVPEVCKHGGSHDRPICLIMSSANDEAVTVEISLPANNSFTKKTRNIAAHSHLTFDLTNYIDLLENRPEDNDQAHSLMNYDQVFKKGIYIKASKKISVAYFIQTGNFYNTEYYALKGRNALGKDFFIPGQNEVDNTNDGGYKNPKPINKFDIVATEDNTTVTIYPRTKNIMQHHLNNDYNTPFTITLNRGETYCCVAKDNKAANHLYGTRVVADQKIAITVTDDMLDFNWSGEDVTGDQIVPVDLLGTEFIGVKGEMNEDRERIYVLAIEDGTKVYVNGSATPQRTINKGQLYAIPFSVYPTDKALSFTTSSPVVVWQTTGFGNEFGAAILPHIKCTGSKIFMYTRTELSGKSDNKLKLNIIIEKEYIDKFEVKVNNIVKSDILKASDFKAVPGNSDWMYASKQISAALFPVNSTISITNESNFHVGAFEGGSSGGCSYGFFTDFAMGYKLELSTNHASKDNVFCEGDSVTFIFNNNHDILSKINLDGPNGFHAEGDSLVLNDIKAEQGGTYRITGEMDPSINSCGVDYAEVDVTVMKNPQPEIGKDTLLCDGDAITIDATCENGVRYHWNTESEEPVITVNEEGLYIVTVYNGDCVASDSIQVNYTRNPQPYIGCDSLFCDNFEYEIGTRIENAKYEWNTGETSAMIIVTNPGTYFVKVDSLGCLGWDTLIVSNIISPVINLGEDETFCDAVYKPLDAGPGAERYEWSNGSTEQQIVANQPGDISCTAYIDKCWGSDTIHFDIIETPDVVIREIGDLCTEGSMVLSAQTDAETTEWSTGELSNDITIYNAGDYMVEVANGPCKKQLRHNIEVCPCYFYLPNSFTPNNDGLNDVWTPAVISENLFASFTIHVYNRWGQEIYKSTSITEGWDGTSGGKMLPMGVYYWVAYYTCISAPEETKMQHGSVTIVHK